MADILYTGFKGVNNSSYQLVNTLQGDTLLLTNSFGGIFRDIENINHEYELVIMFGLDKRLKNTIRFEKVAAIKGNMIFSKADFSKYVEVAEKLKLNYTISEKPTHYLCNEAYYQMMQKMNCPVFFVHIPTMKNMTEDFFEKLKTMFDKYN